MESVGHASGININDFNFMANPFAQAVNASACLGGGWTLTFAEDFNLVKFEQYMTQNGYCVTHRTFEVICFNKRPKAFILHACKPLTEAQASKLLKSLIKMHKRPYLVVPDAISEVVRKQKTQFDSTSECIHITLVDLALCERSSMRKHHIIVGKEDELIKQLVSSYQHDEVSFLDV